MTLENNDETQIQQLINDWTSALCVKDIDRMMVETRDMIINVSGDTAFAHWVSRFTGMPKDHPAGQTWMRATVGYKRQNGRWFIAHEHVSFPLNPETSQIVLTPDI
ncbi:unnamed protein product [Rotaria magnacalcarata]|uniref:SnoaL-like domain-containing protein n=1 Tax=Rotaria magnacalcarata TaxID=392030 RepID=A0A816QQU3_9BILA|nr:unnamed protein product [Rotaria magnacalcarata]